MISVLDRLSFWWLFDVNWSMIEYCCEIQYLLVAIVRRSSACAAHPTKVSHIEMQASSRRRLPKRVSMTLLGIRTRVYACVRMQRTKLTLIYFFTVKNISCFIFSWLKATTKIF